MVPTPSYYDIYKLSEQTLQNIAYYFSYEFFIPNESYEYAIQAVQLALAQWHDSNGNASFLILNRDNDAVLIDRRNPNQYETTVLKGLDRDVYLACDAGTKPAKLAVALQQPENEIMVILNEFARRHWMIYIDEHYLSLAVSIQLDSLRNVPDVLLASILHAKYTRRIRAMSGSVDYYRQTPDF